MNWFVPAMWGAMGLVLNFGTLTGDARDQALEAFYFDADGSTTFSAYREDLPLDVVEGFARKASELLPTRSLPYIGPSSCSSQPASAYPPCISSSISPMTVV